MLSHMLEGLLPNEVYTHAANAAIDGVEDDERFEALLDEYTMCATTALTILSKDMRDLLGVLFSIVYTMQSELTTDALLRLKEISDTLHFELVCYYGNQMIGQLLEALHQRDLGALAITKALHQVHRSLQRFLQSACVERV
jgi:hypothetical protein